MRQKLREVQIKLMRGLLDLVILQFLNVAPRKTYIVYPNRHKIKMQQITAITQPQSLP